MRNALRRFAGVMVGAAAVTAVAALSRVPYVAEPDGHALLRLSWRARGETLATCRRATEAELAGVPAHMRQEVICEGGRLAAYRLFVAIDRRPVLSEVAPGSGVAGDRPIYVLNEFALTPGRHHLVVRFAKDSTVAGESPDHGSTESPDVRQPSRRAVPPLLRLDTTVFVPEHAVLLVTYDSERRRLVLLGGAPDP
jgi:hypothetical protein